MSFNISYLISFLEGIATFISPCLLPMLPIYVSYFAGSSTTASKQKTVKNALGFVLGFTVIFVLMGAFASTLGIILQRYQTTVNVVSGLLVILLGLNFTGILNFHIFKGMTNNMEIKNLGFFSSFTFGVVFSVGWTPCVGAFLGSALALASQQDSTLAGIFMLLSYSIGLGIPFIISALLIDSLKSTFQFIKKNYKVINAISGIFLILVGILIMTGTLGFLLGLLTP